MVFLIHTELQCTVNHTSDSWICLIILLGHSVQHRAVTLHLNICVKSGFIHYIIYWKDTSLSSARDAEILQKSRSHLKLVHTRRVTQSKFNTENSQILGVTIHNLVIMATWCPGFVNLYSMQLGTIVSSFRCCKLLCGQFFFMMLQSASMKRKKICVKVNALLIGVKANVNCLWLLR